MVKLLTSIAGADFSYGPGEKASFDADTEKRLIESGQAEAVEAKKRATKSSNTAKRAAGKPE